MSKYKKEIKHCEKCNKPFSVFPNSTKTLCASCERNNLEETFAIENAKTRASWDESTSIEKTCRDCGKAFKVSRAERIFFESHNMALPKRCPACRKVRKEASKENN